jgi:hypothetical protein
MKNFTITSGNFTAIGNFTAYSALGQRIFVHKRIMESQGLTPASIKYPLFAIVDTKQIGQLDASGKPAVNADGTPQLVDRDQALSIFLTKAEITQAHVDNSTLDTEINNAIRQASSFGLSDASVNALAELV